MSNLTFYRHPVSGHAHRVELLLSLLGLEAEVINVDLMSGAQKKPEFLAKNPFGQVPALTDGDITLADSNAILVYLAAKYDVTNTWLPTAAVEAAQVQQFLSVAAGPVVQGPANARLITIFGAPYDAEKTIETSHKLLSVIDAHLEGKEWLVGNSETIADVANYTYIAHAPEGNVDIAQYKNIQSWLKRIEALQGFVALNKTAIGLAA
ncbi:glutathione S-transferase [uncultured Paraglaciecola sp.]|uniref:glutathione S-transferase n=1 Tax=uncultured Paraglaciecola sp. TaxID=1765024 RepID=UPI0025E3260B|nr:glutathione S-transferase [uncultured Paraglaciecola sp.]